MKSFNVLKIAATIALAFSPNMATKPNGDGKKDDAPAPKGLPEKTTPLRKITVASVCGKFDENFLTKLVAEKQFLLLRVWGVAGKMKPGESDYGSYVKFLGQFRAQNLATGEIFRSATLLLPKFLEDDLAGVMSVGTGGNVNAEFAFELGVKLDMTAATKYVYFADPLTKVETSDALGKLDALVLARPNPLALPAPKQ